MRSAPNDASISIELAQVLTRSDRVAQAITLLEDTVKRQPDSEPAREGLIGAYLIAGNLQGAHDAAEELEKHQPKSASGFYYAGLVAAREQHLDESKRDFEAALKLQPERLDVLASLARVESAQGAFDSAIGRVRAALEQHHDNTELLTLLGSLHFERKDFGQAAVAFDRTRQLNPGLWQPHRNLALVKLATNDINGALDEYQAALGLAPAEPQLVADAARVYEKQGKVDEAIARYEALYRGNPGAQQFAANNLAMLLVTYKKDRASLDRARELTSTFTSSGNGALLDTVGWVQFKRGEYQEALPILERAVERAPESKLIRFHLAMTQLELGLRDRARTNLESALTGADGLQWADEARSALATLKAHA
jgi:tetratricopeptide (TPR) repeat protein